MGRQTRNYIISAKKQPDGKVVTLDVVADSKEKAKQAAERKHDYKLYGITVR